jgi:hypothetical protein
VLLNRTKIGAVRPALVLLLWTLAGGASGQAYECRTPSGNIVRQYGQPCAPGRDTKDPALEAERRKEREREAEKSKKAREMEAAVQQREIRIGMTPEQVVQAWGNPSRTWTEETAAGSLQIWHWLCADRFRPGNVLAFQKGVVASIQRPCF